MSTDAVGLNDPDPQRFLRGMETAVRYDQIAGVVHAKDLLQPSKLLLCNGAVVDIPHLDAKQLLDQLASLKFLVD